MKRFLLKLIGFRFIDDGPYCYRFGWGELSLFTWDIKYEWCGPGDDDRRGTLIIGMLLFSAYIYTPVFWAPKGKNAIETACYGFYLYPKLTNWETTVFQWGFKRKSFNMPWTYNWFSTEYLDYSMTKTIILEKKGLRSSWEDKEKAKKEHSVVFDYRYMLKNGTVQHRQATVSVQRWIWRMRWLPLKKMIRTSIEVQFSDEVGERTGSWKGGCTGCSYEIKPGETPGLCLRRMEKERIF